MWKDVSTVCHEIGLRGNTTFYKWNLFVAEVLGEAGFEVPYTNQAGKIAQNF